jgi:apolipoprotein N-acyltransferase
VSRAARAGWLAAFAVAYFASFPHPVGTRVVDLGLGAAWIAPACLLIGLGGLAPRRAAALGFAAALVAFAAIFHWIYVATVRYGDAPPVVGVLAPILLAVHPAFCVAVFAAAVRALAGAGLASPFAVAALWTAAEHARSWLLTGFPWALLGYAQHDNPALMALASWTGVWGASFAVALGGASLATLFEARGRGRRLPRSAVAALAGVAALHAAGAADLARDPAPPAGPRQTVRVGLLQGDVDQGVKWSPTWAERTLASYEGLTRQAVAAGASLVVWPETAAPGSPDFDAALSDRLAQLAEDTGTTLIVGAVGFQRTRGGARYFDSAYLITPDGRYADRYDKSHLVPFGEYVPLRDLLGHFIGAVARGAATTDVSPGRMPRVLAVPLRDGRTVTLGVPICYELLFPDLVRRFVRDGAEALVAITNDAWYGRTGAPYQFLVMTAVRSAETRTWTARAANTGVSALIDDRGRVQMRTPLFEKTLLVADLPLGPAVPGGSFYVRHGDWLPAGCWIAAVGLGLAAVARSRRRSPE